MAVTTATRLEALPNVPTVGEFVRDIRAAHSLSIEVCGSLVAGNDDSQERRESNIEACVDQC